MRTDPEQIRHQFVIPAKTRIPILPLTLAVMLAAGWSTAFAADGDGQEMTCPGPNLAPARNKTPDRKSSPITLNSREFDAGDAETAEARGKVELRRADQLITTEVLRYNPETETVTMPGKVQYKDSVLHISGASAYYNFITEDGRFEDIDYGITGSSAKGSAAEMEIDSGNHSV